MLLDELRGKPIVAGRNRRVGREHDLRRHSPDRFGGIDAFRCHALPDSSSAAKALCPSFRCTAPGDMPYRRQRAHAADAEQQFLPDPDAVVAAVETRRQLAIFGAVAVDVRIEQQQCVAAHGQLPDARD